MCLSFKNTYTSQLLTDCSETGSQLTHVSNISRVCVIYTIYICVSYTSWITHSAPFITYAFSEKIQILDL